MTEQVVVSDFMHRNLITFRDNQDLREAVTTLLDNNISGAPVLDEQGKVIGILSEKDCLSAAIDAQYYEQPCGIVSEHMSKPAKSIPPEMAAVDLAIEFTHVNYHRFPVVDEHHNLVGIVTRKDSLRILKELCQLRHRND